MANFKVFGYEQKFVKVAKTTPDLTNDVGKILYFPQNRGFALVVKPTTTEVPQMLTSVMDSENEDELANYVMLETDRVHYICQWLFYLTDGGAVVPGTAFDLPEIPSDAVDLTDLKSAGLEHIPDFSSLIKIYIPAVIDNEIVDKHLTFLRRLPEEPERYVYELLVQALNHAIRIRNPRIIALVDCLIKDENVHQLVLKYLNHNPAESKVTSVEEGLIKAVTYEMPMVGDLCKFRTAHDWVYGAVMGVSYSYENLDLSERLLDLMRQRIVPKQVTYKPMVSVPIGSTRPDTSIREYPEYGYPVVPITEDDIKIIYPGNGRLGKSGRYDINFDVERLRERSIGVFGKSGTGKSTLVQLLACEMIRNGETLLIFDEHTELAKTHQAVGMIKPGLQDIFPHCVRTVSFGKSIFNTPDGKQHQADVTMKIPISVITEEDILQISDALILTPTAPFVLSTISRLIKKEWAGEYGSLIEAILFMKHDHYVELTEGSAELPMTVNEHSLNAVRNRLSRIFLRDSDNLNDYYTRSKNPNEMKNSIGQILEWLKQGQSVIINSASDTYGFVLIINVIFRMIINEWQKNKPRPLTIFLEEAHRLIPPNNETLVGMVAREMRKYGATLCIIDQTPKKIDNVVVKQIGTYFIFPLDQSEASCGVMPENLPVGEVLSRLASVGEAYVHGYTFLLPTYVKIHDYYELANGIIKENQKLLGKVGAGQSGGPTLASFYSGNKPGL